MASRLTERKNSTIFLDMAYRSPSSGVSGRVYAPSDAERRQDPARRRRAAGAVFW